MVLSSEEGTLSYLAGFFDGEGCVGIYPKNGRYNASSVRISVAQVDVRPIELFQSVFGGNMNVQTNRTTSLGTKTLYRLQYTGARAKDVLANLYPYLIVKREKAAQALEF